MPKPRAPKSLSNLFTKSSGNLARITEKSQYLNALNHHLVEAVGATVAQKCRVSNYNHNILTIETVNSAFATRLNFMRQQILQNFVQNVLPDMHDIKIKVVPNEQFYKIEPPIGEKNTNQISEKASGFILEAASHAPDSLKRKLERLAQLAKPGSKDKE